MSGSVKVMSFSPIEKEPFIQEPQCDSLFIHYESVLKINNLSSETCVIASVKYAQGTKFTKNHSLLDNRYHQIFLTFRKKFSVKRLQVLIRDIHVKDVLGQIDISLVLQYSM